MGDLAKLALPAIAVATGGSALGLFGAETAIGGELAATLAMEDAAIGAGMTATAAGATAEATLAGISAAEAAAIGAGGVAAGVAAGGAAGTSIMDTLKSAATVLTPVASLIGAASGIEASRRMAAEVPAVPTMMTTPPVVLPPITMPSAAAPIVFQAQRTSLASQLQRRGRASTILTSPFEFGTKLGS